MAGSVSKLKEGVSIIGVGCTPFGSVLNTPEIKGLSEREMFAWAAFEAMEDAGIGPTDLDAFFIGQVMPETLSHMHSSAAQVADWIGMRNKPGFHQECACATSNAGLALAVMAVASGTYKMVLSGGIEITSSHPIDGKPACMREPIPATEFAVKTHYGADQAYSYPAGLSKGANPDLKAILYGRKYGLTWEQLEDALDAVAINNRRNGLKNPLATNFKMDFAEEAKEHGFNNVKEYMRSRYNPIISAITRVAHAAVPMDGASALVVCPTKIARKITDHAIDVIGFGTSLSPGYHLSDIPWEIEEIGFARAYEMANITPKDIDYLHVHDCYTSWQISSAEAAGYFQPGEAWRAVIEGRTVLGGDKPMSTTGGRTTMGHAWGASAGAEIAEAVRQMRGTCGDRQIKPVPETSVIHNIGNNWHCQVSVLRTP